MTQVVAAILRRGSAVLIAQRKAGGAHGLKWEFPGGKIEPGESPQAALARELNEELGIAAAIGAEVDRYEFTYPGKSAILLIFFEVDAFDTVPRNLAFEQIRWAEFRDLPNYDFLEGDVDFVARLATGALLGG
jgi:8-oxo-dGTP diphosphatase